MNVSHSRLTDWGMSHLSLSERDIILDVGCGGGETVRKLAARTSLGKVYGVDYSQESVSASSRKNAPAIEAGRVEIRHGSVSRLSFAAATFDFVTAVETHFWWPDLPGDMREILRVLKPGGQLIIVAEVYKGANTMTSRLAEKYTGRTGMLLLTADEHRQLFTDNGYIGSQVVEEDFKGWICGMGRKPSTRKCDAPDSGR
jgi:ubiquinone/menaquinone biosynthesis C-methylase UbiE